MNPEIEAAVNKCEIVLEAQRQRNWPEGKPVGMFELAKREVEALGVVLVTLRQGEREREQVKEFGATEHRLRLVAQQDRDQEAGKRDDLLRRLREWRSGVEAWSLKGRTDDALLLEEIDHRFPELRQPEGE